MFRINTNTDADLATNTLVNLGGISSKLMSQLSTGRKEVDAATCTSDTIVSFDLDSQSKGILEASENCRDALHLLNVMSATVSESIDMLQEAHSLTVKARNGTTGPLTAGTLNDRLQKLLAEIDRNAASSNFQGVSLIKGELGVMNVAPKQAGKSPVIETNHDLTDRHFQLTDNNALEFQIMASPNTSMDIQPVTPEVRISKDVSLPEKDTAIVIDKVKYNKATSVAARLKVINDALNNNPKLKGVIQAEESERGHLTFKTLGNYKGANVTLGIQSVEPRQVRVPTSSPKLTTGWEASNTTVNDFMIGKAPSGKPGEVAVVTSKNYEAANKPAGSVAGDKYVFEIKLNNENSVRLEVEWGVATSAPGTVDDVKSKLETAINASALKDKITIDKGTEGGKEQLKISTVGKGNSVSLTIKDLGINGKGSGVFLTGGSATGVGSGSPLPVSGKGIQITAAGWGGKPVEATPAKYTQKYDKTTTATKKIDKGDTEHIKVTINGKEDIIKVPLAATTASSSPTNINSIYNVTNVLREAIQHSEFKDSLRVYASGSSGSDLLTFATTETGRNAELKIQDLGVNGSGVDFFILGKPDERTVHGSGPLSGGESVQFFLGSGETKQNEIVKTHVYDFTTQGLGVDDINVKTSQKANEACIQIEKALDMFKKAKADFGSSAKRLEYTEVNLGTVKVNIDKALSSLRDTNYATSTTELARERVLQQTAIAMLTHANQEPSKVITLLKQMG